MTYAEQLQHPLWLAFREKVYAAANYRCEDCGRMRAEVLLEAHHCFYITGKLAWEYELDLMICVCGDCHEFRQEREQGQQIIFARAMRRMRPKELDNSFWTFLDDTMPKPWKDAL